MSRNKLLAASVSLLLVVAVEQPALAEPASTPDCSPEALVAVDPARALSMAAQCDTSVEVESARSSTRRQFAEPDGSLTLESYLRPQWVRDHTGVWVDVDPSLRLAGGGAISTVATVFDIAVSAGGGEALVTATDPAGGTLRLHWPTPLPEPVLDGPIATYAEVFDGVDLQVRTGVDTFSYALVVHSAQAAANPELAAIEVAAIGDGLAVSQDPSGAVVVRDAGEVTVFSATGAYMWDSSSTSRPVLTGGPEVTDGAGGPLSPPQQGGDIPGADPGRITEIEVLLDGDTLRVIPDPAMLADPAVEYPLTIDPTFHGSRLAWSTVGFGIDNDVNGQNIYADETWWDDGAWPRAAGLRSGFMGWGTPNTQGYGIWRSMASFDTEALRGSTINSATVELTIYHTGSCDSQPLQLWQVQPITQGAVPTSWNSTSGDWLHGAPVEEKVMPSANSLGDWCTPRPDRAVEFHNASLRGRVQDNAHAGETSITFGLRAADEGDEMQWIRAYAESFALVVNHTPVLAVPAGLSTDGVGCLAPGGSRVVGTAPLLAGMPVYSEGTVRAQIEVRTATGTSNVRDWRSDPGSSGAEVSWQVDQPLADGDYRWRMRSEHPDDESTSGVSRPGLGVAVIRRPHHHCGKNLPVLDPQECQPDAGP